MALELRRVENPPVMEFEVDGDISLYPSGREHAIVMNRTASDIWRLLAEPQSLEELVGTLAEEYGRPRAEIEPAIRAVVDTLVAEGAVEGHDRSTA